MTVVLISVRLLVLKQSVILETTPSIRQSKPQLCFFSGPYDVG